MDPIAATAALVALGSGVVGLVVARRAVLGVGVAALALTCLRTGTLPTAAAWEGVNAVGLVTAMVFVAAATERSGLLGWIAERLAAGLRRPRLLLAATFAVAVALTTTCNLDTTAVLFTPLALSVAAAAGLDAVPFALASVLAANFGSLLLPTSNLTNLVLWRASGLSFLGFAAITAPAAALAALAAGTALVARRPRPADLDVAQGGDGRPAGDRPIARLADPALARVSAIAVAALIVAFLAGAPAMPAAVVAAAGLVAWRPALRSARLTPRLLGTLLLVFAAAGPLVDVLDVATRLDGVTDWQLAAAGAALSGLATNLAAVLLLEPAATTDQLRVALLVGVDLGVGLTPVASLATVLWADALRRRAQPVPWRAYLRIAVPLSGLYLVATPLLVRLGT